MLAFTDVDGLAFHPPFGADFLGNLLECLVAVLAEVVDDDIFSAVDLPDLPVCDIAHAVIHAMDYHRHMFPGRGGQGEYRLFLVVNGLDYEQTLDHALHAVELDIVAPLSR